MKSKALRTRVENLMLWLIPLSAISAFAYSYFNLIMRQVMGNFDKTETFTYPMLEFFAQYMSMGELMSLLQTLQLIPNFLVHIVIGIWLYRQTAVSGGRRWLWLLGGICLSYWAIALHLFLLILDTETPEAETSSSTPT